MTSSYQKPGKIYPNETMSLLSSTTDSSSSHGSDDNDPAGGEFMKHQPPNSSSSRYLSYRPANNTTGSMVLTVAVILLLAVASCNLFYDIYDDYRDYQNNPDRLEAELVEEYKEIADSSTDLLDEMSLGHDVPQGCEATILITRHCEDLGGQDKYEDGTSHCSYLGFQRSLFLASLFGNPTAHPEDPHIRWPLPTKLYGLWADNKTNKRQYEILHPLSDKSGVEIQMIDFDHKQEDLRNAVYELLSTGQLCKKVVVVIWKHKFIRELAATLGCDKERGCPYGEFDQYAWDDYEFDTVWELQFVYKPEQIRAFPHNESVFHHRSEGLLPVKGWKVLGTRTHEEFDPLEWKRDYYNHPSTPYTWLHHPPKKNQGGGGGDGGGGVRHRLV